MNKNKKLLIVPGQKFDKNWKLPQNLLRRLEKAAELYHADKGYYCIIVCGKWSISYDWHNITPPYTEAHAMKKYLIKLGVGPKDIIMESRSEDTVGNVYYLKKILREHPTYRQFTIICAQQHMKRLKYLCGVFFDKNYIYNFVGMRSNGNYKEEERLIEEEKKLLSDVRHGHEQDFGHKLYISKYYRKLAKQASLASSSKK